MKVFFASFSRASNGAVEHLNKEMFERGMTTYKPQNADYILAIGDRVETFDFVLEWFKKNKPIIHLWSGEISQGTHDEVYRHSMTLMSCLQLCTNEHAAARVMDLCRAVDKEHNIHVVGNVMLDDLTISERVVPIYPYTLVLYNPPTTYTKDKVKAELDIVMQQVRELGRKVIWIEPNGDLFSDVVTPFVTHNNLPRNQFLGLIKRCDYFITNSSCQYYEAPFLINKKQIKSIGVRNIERESKYADMTQTNATENIIKVLEQL